MRINATVASVQSAKPDYAYGQLAKTPAQSGAKAALVRAGIPEDVPDNATVTKAHLVFYALGAWSGTRDFSVQRNSAGWSVSKATWNNKPALTGTVKSVTVGSTVEGTEIRIDVTDHAQLFVSGSATNRGWTLTTTDTVQHSVFGAPAAKYKPWLDFEYVEAAESPSDLHPDAGAVSIAKPTLTFTVPDDTVSIRVLIDAAADAVSPDWDSGEVASAVGMLDLSTTTYPGLATGASTSWAAYAKTSQGWSPISAWASFSRVAKPSLTITSPGSTTGDKTPPITWTAAGQVSWRAQLLKADGTVIDDSRRTTSSDHIWTPSKGLKRVGQDAQAHVRVWDNVNRIATPGDPVYTEAFLDFTLVATDVAPGVDTLTATQVGPTPVVRLAWGGAVADFWHVSRDGEWIGDKLDGTTSEFFDYTASPFTQHVYQVLAATSTGQVSPNGPTATISTRPAGVWLMDEETGKKVLVLDAEVEATMAEQAVVHAVVGDRPPVRRRSGKPPPSGTVTGLLLDSIADDFPAATMAARCMEFKGNGQGHVYRLTADAWNIPVTIGDMTTGPALLDQSGRASHTVSFSWWQTDDEIPWAG